MKVKVNRLTLVGVLAAATATVVTAPAVFSQGESTIEIDGSSTVFPIAEAVAEEFQATSSGVQVIVGVSGTGGGFERFCAGETAISNASRPIKAEEAAACEAAGVEFIELPVGIDALTVVVNPQNDWVDNLTFEELKTLWEPEAEGTITTWNQIRSSFPSEPIDLYGPGTDSGTFDYFTEEVVGEGGASRADYTASEDDNVLVQGVAGDEYALGYFGYAYYEANSSRLKAVPIDAGEGAVAPSAETVADNTYPLSRPLFIYVSTEAAQRPEVQQFVEFFLNSPELVSEVGYIPLSAEEYEAAKQKFASGETGTTASN